jgi:hypothetical protein
LGVRAVAVDDESLHGDARGIINGKGRRSVTRSIEDGSSLGR